ncbi:hypothetical protein LLG95_18330 [bacterium]|nr:hypothetical protein [bacterium]
MRAVKIASLFVLLSVAAFAADWSAWKKQMPIRLGRIDPETIGLLPIDATVSLKAADMSNPKNPGRELKLVYMGEKKTEEVPFQISRAGVWDRDSSPSVKTFNARITFFPVAGDQSGTYTLLYCNANSQQTTYTTDLKVSGKGPHWTIENSLIKVQLREADKEKSKNIHNRFGNSGQIASVRINSRPNAPVTNPYRSIHWNPGVLIPKRGWVHAYAWDPPKEFEIEQGPIFVEVRRRGPLPLIPEVEVGITYRFFKERSFIQVGTRTEVTKNVGTASLRNNCCVFGEKVFSHMAWEQFGEVHKEEIAKYKPVNRHGDLVRLKPDTPWFAVWHPETKIGAATVFVSEDNVGPSGSEVTQFDHAFYFTHNSNDKLIYWFRPQVYFLIDWDRKQLVNVPKSSVYAEQNYYYFYDVEKDGQVEGVRRLSRAALNPPDIKVGPYIFAPPQ